MFKNPQIRLLLLSLTSALLISCAQNTGFKSIPLNENSSDSNNSQSTTSPSSPTPSTPPDPSQTPVQTPAPQAFVMEPLAWESSTRPQATEWSQHIFATIENNTSYMMNGADDVTEFCPKYAQLSTDQKANFWAMLFSGIAKYESAFDPTNRYQESTMGTDPVTGQPVYSEGLLQLSYQDTQWMPSCQFNWSVDKNLSPTDPNKTILNPNLNLDCGVYIMDNQIRLHHAITLSSSVYWSTLKIGGTYNQISGIQEVTKKLTFCN